MFARFIRRCHYLWKRTERERLLEEEVRSHLELHIEELMEQGMPRAQAEVLARRRFGNLTRTREESRAVWLTRWAQDLVQDLRYAIRTLAGQPGFAAVAILSAALGIGACSTIFGIANFALFRSLKVSEPDRLVSLSGAS